MQDILTIMANPISSAADRIRDQVQEQGRLDLDSLKALIREATGRKRVTKGLIQEILGEVEGRGVKVIQAEGTIYLDVDRDPPSESPVNDNHPTNKQRPPAYMACGHFSWWAEDGTPKTCSQCQKGVPGNPVFARGDYAKRPVHEKLRRTPEKEHGLGWPGYCCTQDGIYIGGVYNDCRQSGGQKCSAHRTKNRR